MTFVDVEELNDIFYVESIPAVRNTLMAAEKEYIRKISMYELTLSAYMTDVLIQALRRIKMNNSLIDGEDIKNKIINYIQENFNKNLLNKEISEHFHYHPNYISNLIKQYTGYPLHQYIKNIRITKAADMLLVTEKSSAEVASACGFYDPSHFIKCFKEIMGMTPFEYKNKYR